MTSKTAQPPRRQPANALIDRQPPCDLQAEIGLLGSVVLLPSVLPEIAAMLKPEDFYDSAHAAIYRHMLALHNAGKPLDDTLLIDAIKAAGEWETIGGAAYLSRVVNAVPNAAHARYYAEIVAGHSLRRRLIEECTRLLREAYDQYQAPEELLTLAEAAISKVARRMASRVQAVRLGDAAQQVIADLESCDDRDSVNRAMFGLPSVDEALGPIMPGELCIVAGRPGSGKTAFAHQMLRHAALSDRACLMVSLEMTDRELATRDLCRFAGIDSRAIRSGDVSVDNLRRLKSVQQDLTELPFFVWAPPKATLANLRSVAIQVVAKLNVRLIAIDYFQLIAGESNTGEDRREQFVHICHGLKALAKELSLPIVVLSQLNRLAENAEPTKAMLRETGAIEEDADCILFLHQPDPKRHDERVLIAAKFRHSGVGRLTLKWNGRRTEFSDLSAADCPNYEPAFSDFNRREAFA